MSWLKIWGNIFSGCREKEKNKMEKNARNRKSNTSLPRSVQWNLKYAIEQCFSTFWASSPGWRQILTSLSRSQFFLSFSPSYMCFQSCFFYYKMHRGFAFCLNCISNHFLTKFNNWYLFNAEFREFLSFKNSSGGWETLPYILGIEIL